MTGSRAAGRAYEGGLSAAGEPLSLEELAGFPAELHGLQERERRFAEAYFGVALEHGDAGASATMAYKRAFPSSEVADASMYQLARNLLRSPRVTALLTWLRLRLAERQAIPAARLVDEIERIAYSNILDYVDVDAAGQASVNLRRLTPRTASAVSEVETTERTMPDGSVVRRTKIKLAPKMDALDKLARVHGLFQDRINVNFNLDDIDRAIQRMETELQQRRIASAGTTIEHQE